MNVKYKSRKFLAALWAGILITFLSTISVATQFDPPWMSTLMPMLTSIVVVYVGGQSLIDKESIKNKDTNCER